MSRYAQHRRVYFIEEPIFTHDLTYPYLEARAEEHKLQVIVPHLPASTPADQVDSILANHLQKWVSEEKIKNFTSWYYTPMAMAFTRHLQPEVVVYDCMDELSLFKGAPAGLLDFEKELMEKADAVFTGGQSLYEHKRTQHQNIYPFPSSIDLAHFARARKIHVEREEQRNIERPRIGFCGVIDERMNIELLAGMAKLRPHWQFIMIGPVVKIDPADLPHSDNIHYLGKKSYEDLPQFLAGWDLAMMPFALNDSTRFISPTKTPEYLAAGLPVVSTSIRDVVRPYGEKNLVKIADDAATFVEQAEIAMEERRNNPQWMATVDAFLGLSSWDRTWQSMAQCELDCHPQSEGKRKSKTLTMAAGVQ
jgi:UDP-galactopyranose mutase